MVEEKKKVGRPRKKDEVEKAREETAKELKESLKPGIMASRPLPQFLNLTNFKFVDISAELFREYLYPNGNKLRIEYPLKLSIAKNNAHRVFDANGLSYYIPANWIAIVTKARPGAPNFIM